MKYFILFLLLITPLTYAQDLILAKQEYTPKQTFQAEIFLKDIKPYDVSILNPIGYRTNIGSNLIKLTDNHYFIFFDVPELDPGNYTLKVKESKQQFKIKPKVQKTISFYPPAIKHVQQDSPLKKITISNHNTKSETIEITSSSQIVKPSINSLIIPGKASKSFYLTLENQDSNQLIVISISDYYNLPVWFIINEDTIPFLEKEVEKIQLEEQGLKFFTESKTQLNSITKEIQESVPIVDSIYFKNFLNETISNLKISITGNLQDIVILEFEELKNLVPNEEKKLGITINEERSLLEESYSGDLIITSDKNNFKLPMNFIVTKEQVESTEPLTIEEIPEPLEQEPEINQTEQEPAPKLKGKWIYLIILIIILIGFAYLSLKKPEAKKQTFKQYVKKIKK